MLKITVKTMDSNSRVFDVPEQITIKDFKTRISSEVNIAPDRQRLIFQGRVLSDDFKLNKDHNEKVLHLVQRLPVSTTTSAPSTTTQSTGQQRPPQTSQANPLFSTNQLSQIFQQALGGLGNVIGGSGAMPVISGTVLSSDSNGTTEQTMNFHIEVGSSNAAPSTTSQVPPNPTFAPTPSAPVGSHNPPPTQAQGLSAPRRQLNQAKHCLFHLKETLTELEGSNAGEASGTPTTSSVFSRSTSGDVVVASGGSSPTQGGEADSNMDTTAPPSSQSTTASATAQARINPHNHPSFAELSEVYSDLVSTQRRLNPFLDYMATFLNTDPPFTSIESEEFRSTSNRISMILKMQQLTSQVQSILSQVALPLGRTPPRQMLVRAPPGVAAMAQGARMVHHHMQAPRNVQNPPMYVPPNRGPTRPPGSPQIRVVRMTAPIGTTPAQRLHRPRMSASTAGRPTQASSPASEATGNAAQVSISPPTYTVQVNATIQPNIQVTVNQPGAQPTTTSHQLPQTASSSPQTPAAPLPSQSTAQNASMPAFPNIPGVPSELFNSLINNITQQVQQGSAPSPNPAQGLNAGVVIMGTPQQENQIASDISNMMGQAVTGAMFEHLTEPSTDAPPQTTGATPASAAPSGQQTNTEALKVKNDSSRASSSGSAARNQSHPDNAGTEVSEMLQGGGFGPRGSSPSKSQGAGSSRNPFNAEELSAQEKREVIDIVKSQSQAKNAKASTFLELVGFAEYVLPATGGNVLERLVRTLGGAVTAEDFEKLLAGDEKPLLKVQAKLKKFVVDHYFGGNTPERDDIQAAAETLSVSFRPVVEKFFSGSKAIADVDIVESNLSLHRCFVRKAMQIIIETAEPKKFATDFNKHLRLMLATLVRMNEHLLKGGRSALCRLIESSKEMGTKLHDPIPRVLACFMPPFQDPVTSVVDVMSKLSDVRQEQIDQFVISQKQTSTSASAVASRPREAQQISDWKKEIPAEWVDTIVGDIKKQENMSPQPPFSEAYMAGMPASKRRKVVS